MMGRSGVRAGAALLLVALAIAAALVPVGGIPGGADEQNWQLCGDSKGCHGISGANTSSATVWMETDSLTIRTGQEAVRVTVHVTGAEQRAGDPIGVMLLRDLVNPPDSLPKRDGWALMEDPKGRVPGYNFARVPAQGTSGDTWADLTWLLRAPDLPGQYRLVVRMQTGLDEEDEHPLSRDFFAGLLFDVVPPPRLLDSTPRNGSEDVFVNSPVVLAFSKAMDRPTVEAAFSIDPPVNGTFLWEGNRTRFVVDGFLQEATTYTYTLDTTARDADGIGLLEGATVSFTTGSGEDKYPPSVVAVVASRAPLDALVRVAFDEPMDRASVEAAFSIEPSVPGSLSWEGDTLVFTGQVEFDYDTIYTVRVAATATDLGGNHLSSSVTSTFRTVADTEPPRVLSTLPEEGVTDVPIDANVTLVLSDDVDPGTLGGAVSWDPPVLADLSWEGATATLSPRHSLLEGTRYNLTVSRALADVRGNTLASALTLSFTTAGSSDREAPSMVSASPSPGGTLRTDGAVRLTFSEPMDAASVASSLMVSPVVDYQLSWAGEVLTVSFEGLEAGRVYTVNLAEGVSDLAGNGAREPYTLRYVAAPPAASEEPFFHVEGWLETWWDLALVVVVVALVLLAVAVQLWLGWRRVVLTAFAWLEERVRTARYMGEARRLYYSINRQMPHDHAERYGSKIVWYWYPFYCLGGIAILSFVVCGVTGIVLGLYYEPSASGSPSGAYLSVQHIMEDVSFGYMFRAIHHWSANIMIAAVFLHMLRVFFTGAYRNPRELNWVAGVALLGLTLAYGYSGYLLPWNQLSYWAGTIGLEMTRTIPIAGDWFAELVFGGVQLGGATLTRMYFLHALVLPVFTFALMAVHLVAVYIQGLAEPH